MNSVTQKCLRYDRINNYEFVHANGASINIQVSRLKEMMEDVTKLPPSALPDEGYGFHLRAATLSYEWAQTCTFSRWCLCADLQRLSVYSMLTEDMWLGK
jgi:hypothetical protein